MDGFSWFGSITALATPFVGGKIDVREFQNFVLWQMKEGTHGFVTAGTTGESPTLKMREHGILLRACLEVTQGSRIPVIAGCGANSTDEAVILTRQAQRLGAQAALHVVPYYNKPPQEGLYKHFEAIHNNTDIPIILYSVPGRTVVDLHVKTVARLAKLPRIIGIKDASGDLTRPVKTRQLCGPGFLQYSGNDDSALEFLAQGGHGCISVVSNIIPGLCAQMHNAWRAGDLDTAVAIDRKVQPLIGAIFNQTNPLGVKCALALMERFEDTLRLPLVPANKGTREKIRAEMGALNLIR